MMMILVIEVIMMFLSIDVIMMFVVIDAIMMFVVIKVRMISCGDDVMMMFLTMFQVLAMVLPLLMIVVMT